MNIMTVTKSPNKQITLDLAPFTMLCFLIFYKNANAKVRGALFAFSGEEKMMCSCERRSEYCVVV